MSQIKCPQCKKETEYDPKNPYRPFCSKRCQTTDLGQWADEKYVIHNPNQDESENDEHLINNDDGSHLLH